MAVIAVNAKHVKQVMEDCVEVGIKAAVIISAGFKETGAEGAQLEREVYEIACKGKIRVVGPNCLGVMNPIVGLNATFATQIAKPGNVAFISQSGAMCTSILDWSLQANVGFSSFVSIGSMLDVSWGDIIYYLGDDPNTKAIAIYMETIGDARSFMSAAAEVAMTKPIIVIKPGRTEQAAAAAASHTGSLAGSDDVLDAAFKRCGVLRVNKIREVFEIVELLGKQPRPKGKHLTIVTNAGGPGVISTDALIESGGQLSWISDDTMKSLNEILPPHWSHSNPIDILGDATPATYAKVVEIAAQDEYSDGILIVLTPQSMTDPSATARGIAEIARKIGGRKPILASWMGGKGVEEGRAILDEAGIPTYDYPDSAAEMFSYMYKYSVNLSQLYETPRWCAEMHPESLKVDTIIAVAQSSGSKILTELESKRLLGAYGIPSDDNLGSYCRGSCSRRRWSWISGGSQDQLGDNYSQDERRKSQVEIHSAEQVHAAAQYAPLLPLDQQQHVQHAVLSIRSVEERRLFHV
jgi:acetyltransferase